MEGVTHPAFRELMSRQGGIGVVCTEFVRITSAPPGGKLFRRQIVAASRSALSVQVMGNHIEHLADATALVADSGADLVDLNVGCPAPRVVRKGVGAALLQDLGLLSRVVSAMRARTNGWLSAKVRAGFDSSSGAVDLARCIEASGADLIAVHARRRSDFYRGVADWRVIQAIKRAVRIPVIGNGDIWYAADALRMIDETGCDGVMIGRGALRNPWIFTQIAALGAGDTPPRPTGIDVIAHLRSLEDLLSTEGVGDPLGPLKEHVRYLGRALHDGGNLLRVALRAQNASELLEIMETHLAPLPAQALDLDAHGGVLERSGSASAPGNVANSELAVGTACE
jgi:tRNA-dihydrouridine synthase B